LSRLVGPSIADEPDALRDYIYGRALARLLAHELYHVLVQTTAHAQAGVAKAQLTAAELLANRFQFEGSALGFSRPEPHMPAPAESALVNDQIDELAVRK
jgi:hypothetical protein